MIRIAVVEDHPGNAEQIQNFIERYAKENGEVIETIHFSDGIFLVEQYKARYDIIFMDIQMKLMNGMEAAEKIRKMDSDVILVFITNYVEYAIKGYAVKALNYILKPINYFDFSEVLSESIKQIRNTVETYISIRQPNGIVRMPASDIYYIESSNHIVTYHTKKGNYSVRDTLRELEERLKNQHFSRCNTCYLVNLSHVVRIDQNIVVVGNDTLAVSRPKRKAFLEDLTSYMGGKH